MADWFKYMKGPAGAVTVGAAAATAALYWATRPSPLQTLIDLDSQTQLIPDTGDSLFELARSSRLCPADGSLVEKVYDDVGTFYEAFQRGARISENGHCLGWREDGKGPYKWLSYNGVLLRAADVGAGLLSLNLQPENTTRIGIYSQNRVEYVLTQLACCTYSMTFVALYDTLGPDVCTFIINQAEIEIVMCDKNTHAFRLLSHKKDTPQLRVIILVETPTDENVKLAKENSVRLIMFSELEVLGQKKPQDVKPSKPDDLFTICYTSGTTGTPKGAMTTHRNLIASVSGTHLQLKNCGMGPGDVTISYLPLAHSYETMTECYAYMNGAAVGFYSGDVKLLMDDIQELRPTVFPTVPRLLNRVYDKVMASVNTSAAKKMMFSIGLSSKLGEVKRGVVRRDSMWDSLVFKKVQETLGGRCRVISTGSAPISSRVLNFIRVATGAVVVEGYGQTECAAVCSLQLAGEGGSGHVGCPLPCNLIKLVDVPEMGYYARDNKGEICIKGPNVFKGYLKNAEKTAEALDADGWLHTGDVGCWLENGALKIVDRKKNIFKLAQGEYIAPEKIENIYIRCPALAQVFVHGDSLKSCLVAIAVPDPEVIKDWVKTKLGIEGSLEDLCNNQELKKVIHEDMLSIGKKASLHSFEQVRDIYLHPEMFSVDNGLLTPTFKSKRHDILQHFTPQIDRMYLALD